MFSAIALGYDSGDAGEPSLARDCARRARADVHRRAAGAGGGVTFRSKLFVVFTLALLLSVGLIAAGVTLEMRRASAEWNRQQSESLAGQFQREVERRRQDVARRVQAAADAEGTIRMAIELSRPKADVSVYSSDARGVSQSHHLDFLDFAGDDGSIISSAEWPARVGAKMAWLAQPDTWAARGAFLTKVDTPDGAALGLLAVSTLRVGDKNLYVVGGERLDKGLLAALTVPPGTRALLYLDLDSSFQDINLVDESGPVAQGERLEPFVSQQRRQPGQQTFEILWTSDQASAEAFHALPLLGRQNEFLAALLVGSSQRDAVILERRILRVSSIIAGAGLLLGILVSWWGAARVTRPARELAQAVREVSEGNWKIHVHPRGPNEMGQLARDFNRMTGQLTEQRERMLQAERVAAWRDVARGLAREVEKSLAPLQAAADNFDRAKDQNPELLDEVARASAGALVPGLASVKTVAGRFQNFAKPPQMAPEPVNLNEIVRGVVKLFEPQFSAVGRPPITPELHLDESLPAIQADAALLRRAIENLVLNAMDAMPAGGVLMLRTTQRDGGIDLEVADTGTGLAAEEHERLFTPGYAMKQHGADMGLAIVQAIVSDHGGRISVESEAGVGTSFHVHLLNKPPQRLASAPIATPSEEV